MYMYMYILPFAPIRLFIPAGADSLHINPIYPFGSIFHTSTNLSNHIMHVLSFSHYPLSVYVIINQHIYIYIHDTTKTIYIYNITITIDNTYIYCHIPLGRPSLMLIPWSSHGFLPRSRRVDDRSQGWDACARLGLWRLLCHPGLSFSAHRSCWLMGFTTLFI